LLLIEGQGFAQPTHGAIQVLQFQLVDARDAVILFPTLASAIAAGSAQAMQDGEEDGALDGELKAAWREQLGDDWLAAGFLPQALEYQRRSDALAGQGGHLAVAMGGDQETMFSEARAGGEQAIKLTRLP